MPRVRPGQARSFPDSKKLAGVYPFLSENISHTGNSSFRTWLQTHVSRRFRHNTRLNHRHARDSEPASPASISVDTACPRLVGSNASECRKAVSRAPQNRHAAPAEPSHSTITLARHLGSDSRFVLAGA